MNATIKLKDLHERYVAQINLEDSPYLCIFIRRHFNPNFIIKSDNCSEAVFALFSEYFRVADCDNTLNTIQEWFSFSNHNISWIKPHEGARIHVSQCLTVAHHKKLRIQLMEFILSKNPEAVITINI